MSGCGGLGGLGGLGGCGGVWCARCGRWVGDGSDGKDEAVNGYGGCSVRCCNTSFCRCAFSAVFCCNSLVACSIHSRYSCLTANKKFLGWYNSWARRSKPWMYFVNVWADDAGEDESSGLLLLRSLIPRNVSMECKRPDVAMVILKLETSFFLLVLIFCQQHNINKSTNLLARNLG